MHKIQCMKDLSIFQNLSPLEREKIGSLAGKKVYSKDEFIFREGDQADTIYLIKSGRVRLFKVSTTGKEITLDILKEDGILGENTFFEDAEQTMNAQAIENTFICSCSRSQLPLLLANPQTAMKIIQLLGGKIQNYTEQVARIAFDDVKSRTSATLIRLAREYGRDSIEGTLIDIELTHQDLANLVNASRVMVSNVMGHLKRQGAISTEGRRITMLNRDKLSEASKAI